LGITTTKSANVTCTSIWDFLCLRLAAHDIYSLTLSLAMETQSQKQAHLSLLAQFLTSYPFRDVLLLASLDSASGTTEDHLFNPLQVLFPPASSSDDNKQEPTSTVSESETDTLKQRLSRIPEYIPPSPSQSYTMPNKSSTSSYPPFLPNGGLTRRLLLTLHQQSNPAPPPYATLVYWCTEADNRDDALRFAGVVTYALGIRTSAPPTFLLPLWLFSRHLFHPVSEPQLVHAYVALLIVCISIWVRIAEGQVKLSPPRSWDGLFGSRMASRAMGSGAADIYG
jgi:hypothetical protein